MVFRLFTPSGDHIDFMQLVPFYLPAIIFISPRTLFKLQNFTDGMLFGCAHGANILFSLMLINELTRPDPSLLSLIFLFPLAVTALIFAVKTEKLLFLSDHNRGRFADHLMTALLIPIFLLYFYAIISGYAKSLEHLNYHSSYQISILLGFLLINIFSCISQLFCIGLYFVKARRVKVAGLSVNWLTFGVQWVGLMVTLAIPSYLLMRVDPWSIEIDDFNPLTSWEWAIWILLFSHRYTISIGRAFMISAFAPSEKARKSKFILAGVGIILIFFPLSSILLDGYNPENLPEVPQEIACDPKASIPVTIISVEMGKSGRIKALETYQPMRCEFLSLPFYHGSYGNVPVVKKPETIAWVSRMASDPSVHHLVRTNYANDLFHLKHEPQYDSMWKTISGRLSIEAWPADKYPAQVELELAPNRYQSRVKEDGGFVIRVLVSGVYSVFLVVEGHPLSDLKMGSEGIEIVNLPAAIRIFNEDRGETVREHAPGTVEIKSTSNLDLGEIVVRKRPAVSP